MKPLVITEAALQALATTPLPADWYISPSSIAGTPIRGEEGVEGYYVFTTRCTPLSSMLVIAQSEDGLFKGIADSERRGVFDRCLRLALHCFDPSVSLNTKWMPFHSGNRLSIFAFGLGHQDRILAEKNVRGEGHAYIFDFGEGVRVQNLARTRPDYDQYERALAGFLILGRQNSVNSPENTYELAQIEESSVTKGLKYTGWYRLLTRDQLRFVEHPLTGPLRLRGTAGTGKTLALAMKALKTKKDADASGEPVKILIITHSWAMAEFVDRLISSMDENPETVSTIDVFPLLSLSEQKDYLEIGRRPLGIDSDDGKRLALEEIGQVVHDFTKSDWVAYRPGCSADFVAQVEADPSSKIHRLFCWDLLVEFGCVIAAQGILTSGADRDRYLRVRRQRWMMELENIAERSVAFALWQHFMRILREKGLIQIDQIISDHLNELSTFYWEAARAKKGYDLIFVDETHLFNSQERLVFHHLLRDGDKPPLVVMALDPKQSPRETYTSVEIEGDPSGTSNMFERARLPNPDKIDLIDVFRYSPEIGRLISVIRAAAPGLDPEEDWDIPDGNSVAPSGPVPRVKVVDDAVQSFRTAIVTASALQKEVRANGGRVAVLCMDDSRFERYRVAAAGQFKSEAFVIASRDDIEGLRYAGRKIVVSTPEYVAGLQFDTVILVDVNKDHVPGGKYHGFHLRRFLSELYLGVSRAQRDLVVIASRDQGGLAPVLDKSLQDGVMVMEA